MLSLTGGPGVTNPTRKSPQGILQKGTRPRKSIGAARGPPTGAPDPTEPHLQGGHLKEGVCPSALTILTEDRAGLETCTTS